MPDASPIRHRLPVRRLISPAELGRLTGDKPHTIRELVHVARVRRFWLGGPRLDHAEYVRKIGVSPLSITTGRAEHSNGRSGVIRAAQPRTIGIAQKKRLDRDVTLDRAGDSRDADTSPIAGFDEHLRGRHPSDAF